MATQDDASLITKAISAEAGVDKTRSIAEDKFNQLFVRYTYANGSTETRYGGFLAWRNKNPGNLVLSEGKAEELGAIGRNKAGYGIFPDVETGNEAMREIVLRKSAWQDLTLPEMLKKYAPKDDKKTPTLKDNNPEVYARNVANITGFDANTMKTRLMSEYAASDEESAKIIGAMKQVEDQRAGITQFIDPRLKDLWIDKDGEIIKAPRSASVAENTAMDGPALQRKVVPWESLTDEQQMDLKPLQAWNEKDFVLGPNAKGTWVSSHDSRGNEKTIQLFGSEEMRGQVAGMNAQQAAAQIHQEMIFAQQEKGSGIER